MNLLKHGFNPWRNPDYNVRLAYAQRARNQKKLVFLAINDVHEAVRIAAVKSLTSDVDRLAVVASGHCDRTVGLALRFMCSDEARKKAALMAELPASQRIAVIEAIEVLEEAFLLELAKDEVSEQVVLFALNRCSYCPALDALYSELSSDAVALAILNKTEDEAFAARIYGSTENVSRRLAAINRIRSPDLLAEFYFQENDLELRGQIVSQCSDNQLLIRFFEDEDDEGLRVVIASRINDPEWLGQTAVSDYDAEVRRCVVRSIRRSEDLVAAVLANNDAEIVKEVLRHDLDDASLVRIAQGATSAVARIGAVTLIRDIKNLEPLQGTMHPPDIRWFSGRRLGHLPIDALREIDSSSTLLKAAEGDSNHFARMAAMRLIDDSWALEKLAGSEDARIASLAAILLKEESGPADIRFLQVPNRPYQMSVFPVTGEQFARWKESIGDLTAAEHYAALYDFPITDVSIEEVNAFCRWLSRMDPMTAAYRLPYFQEWKHAAVCDAPEWFSTGSLRSFANAEESELILFGKDYKARPMHEAVPNPWGFLDMIGSVMEWAGDRPPADKIVNTIADLDEFARLDDNRAGVGTSADYAYASGNHWGDRRIRMGRWKRLIHKKNLAGAAAGKIGFRILRTTPQTAAAAAEHELILKRRVALGYSREEVLHALSRTLLIDHREIESRHSVAPLRIALSRNYPSILRTQKTWESCGAVTEIVSKPIQDSVLHA